MAENPQTWGTLEHVIADALDDFEASMKAEIAGYSQVACIANALRAEGLVKECPKAPSQSLASSTC
jgi:hypothetical protein